MDNCNYPDMKRNEMVEDYIRKDYYGISSEI